MEMMDRDLVVTRLREDLIGPSTEAELLVRDKPSDLYLTAILWPKETSDEGENDEKLGVEGQSGGGDNEDSEAEQVPASVTRRPATAGVSFAIGDDSGTHPRFSASIEFALYKAVEVEEESGRSEDTTNSENAQGAGRRRCNWQRVPFSKELQIEAVSAVLGQEAGLPSDVELHVRAVPWQGHRLVTVTMVNGHRHAKDAGRISLEEHTLFQVGIHIEAIGGSALLPRPSRRTGQDEDDRVASVIYRNAKEYATGHTCSAYWNVDAGGRPVKVGSAWLPEARVPVVTPEGHEVFRQLEARLGKPIFHAQWLAGASDEELAESANGLAEAYRAWITIQEGIAETLAAPLKEAAEANLKRCRSAADRIAGTSEVVRTNPDVALCLRLANRAMTVQFGWDEARSKGGHQLTWRPFQLAFILLALPSLADRTHPHRETMDLLWFPTGGGKTEAYLALVAFTAFLRRLRYDEQGVSSIMRYTLRLLTTQQFERATALMLACEAIRRRTVSGLPQSMSLGEAPLSIGLWVGGDATPNTFIDAEKWFSGDRTVSSPVQLTACPSCHARLKWVANRPLSAVEARCGNVGCVLHFGGDPLPIHTVDTDVYREKPTLLIGTVDKFAQVVRREEIADLFGVIQRQPPDLVLQDELHLISGPLGTVAGLYEAALDMLFERKESRVKIIGSTATIRRASDQVRALFDRETCQFPPPAINHEDSGFAVIDENLPGRLYCAVSTAGRSAKFTLQAVSASLLQSASRLDASGRDPYWTLVAYFNSLRELGGALVLMQDDVMDSIALYARTRDEPPRELDHVEELTSRRTQQEILEMLGRISEPESSGEALDVVLATNMLSVGVDIPRLGLMLVNGQPKATAEYIQATSRVGRGSVAGLIVNVTNNGKARDRSRFETFPSWHTTLYRDVEATSVTPFASRARDRALHAVVVAVVRHLVPGLGSKPGLSATHKSAVGLLLDRLEARARRIDPDETQIRQEMSDLLKRWLSRKPKHYWNRYEPNGSLLQDAERAATLRAQGRTIGEAWPSMNNMRSVEPATCVRIVGGLAKRELNADGDVTASEVIDDDRW